MRTGMIISMIGLGVAVGISLASIAMKDDGILIFAGLGVVAFFLGLGFILNGVFLTIPKRGSTNRSTDAEAQRELDGITSSPNDLKMPEPASLFSSVTENTTRHLKEKFPVRRD